MAGIESSAKTTLATLMAAITITSGVSIRLPSTRVASCGPEYSDVIGRTRRSPRSRASSWKSSSSFSPSRASLTAV